MLHGVIIWKSPNAIIKRIINHGKSISNFPNVHLGSQTVDIFTCTPKFYFYAGFISVQNQEKTWVGFKIKDE